MKYPRLLVLLCSFVLAIVLYEEGIFHFLVEAIDGYGYVSMFFGGILFSVSFTTAISTAFFIEVAPAVDPLIAAPIAGAGALLTDLCLFSFFRTTFEGEFRLLRSERWLRWLRRHLSRYSLPQQIRTYFLWSFAGIIIASPLPDEIGISLLSSVANVESRRFAVFCFLVNTTAIFLILLASKAVA